MKLTSFKQFMINENKEVYFTFGRMNPPTIGHGKLLDKLSEVAGKTPYRIYLSHTTDSNKNPLLYESKLKIVRKFFPKHGRNVLNVNEIRDILGAAVDLYENGFKKINLVVGEDRVQEFDILLNKYNGVVSKHGHYVFESIKVISAGLRDPDSEGIDGVSSSKLREAARQSNFLAFSQGLPREVTTLESKRIFNEVRMGMGLQEVKTFSTKLSLDTTDLREQYYKGQLFNIGDNVILKESNEKAKVVLLGANYIIVETTNGKKVRKWLNSVEKQEG